MEFTQEVPAAAPQPKNNQRLTLSMQPAYFSQIVQEYWLGISLKFVVKNNDFILLYYTYRHAVAAASSRQHSGQENLKKSRPKICEMKYIIAWKKFFLPKSIFSSFKNGQKSIFELGKSLKLNIFHENQNFP